MVPVHRGMRRTLLPLTAAVMASATVVAAADPPAAPIAHWTLDEPDGDQARDAVGGHHGTVHGAKPHEQGVVSRGRLFVRSEKNHVEVPYHADFDIPSFTMSAWIQLTKPPTYSGIVGTRHGGKLELGRWYLVTYVVDDATKECRLYLNGDRKKTIPYKGTPRLMKRGQKLLIGCSWGTEFMDGVIDDVKIWNRPFAEEQVRELAMR